MAYTDSEKKKAWLIKNRERILAYKIAYRADERNMEKMRAWFRIYRDKNREKMREYSRNWYHAHIASEQQRSKEYRDKHPEKALNRKRLWRKNHLEKYQASNRAYMKNNLNARLANGLRARVILAVKAQNAQKKGHTEELLGCTIPELRLYLEKQFTDGMSWENWGRISMSAKTWNIDHIIPCNSFNLADESEQRKCFHYTNLQPLWAFDNLSKGINNATARQTKGYSLEPCSV